MDKTWLAAISRPLTDCESAIRAARNRRYPEPHALEGAPLLEWQRLTAAAAFLTKAIEKLGQLADPAKAATEAIDPDEIAELETLAGFTQEADERISARGGYTATAADKVAIDYHLEEDMPWQLGGAEPGE